MILGIGGAAGALAFTLGLGWWKTRSRAQSGAGLLPLPIADMSFTLTDHRGNTVRPADWIGRPTMVFFGFTWCPDVCPTTLSDISGWLDELGPDADRLPSRCRAMRPTAANSLLSIGYRRNGIGSIR